MRPCTLMVPSNEALRTCKRGKEEQGGTEGGRLEAVHSDGAVKRGTEDLREGGGEGAEGRRD